MDSVLSPPILTLVLDAGNRCAAVRANFASGADPLPEEVSSLAVAGIPQADSAAQPPFLIEGRDPQRWARLLREAPLSRLVHLVFPAGSFADAQTRAALAGFDANAVRLMACGALLDEPLAAGTVIDASEVGSVQLNRSKGPHLATGIESHAVYRQCREAGFQWFEGNWFHLPETGQPAQTAVSRATLMSLLGLVARDADSHEIEALLKRDPALSYQLLKLVNSPTFSLTHKIESFNQAITVLGRRQLQRWLQLLLFAGQYASGAVSTMLLCAACRAAFMEALAELRGGTPHDRDRAFMVGLFSLLDSLFAMPIADLIVPLNLDGELTGALIAHEGTLGRMLDLSLAVESVCRDAVMRDLAEFAIAPEAFVRAQLRAAAWAAQVSRSV